MAQQNKVSSAGSRPKGPPGDSRETRSKRETDNVQEAAAQAVRIIGRGRRPGKRSDPAFRPTTFFVRRETQRKAARLLEDQETGKDLSDLIEDLLAKWISENENA